MPKAGPTKIPDAFGQGELRFVCDTHYVNASLPGALNVPYNDLGDTLLASGQLPLLGEVPIAAWVLARAAALSGRRFPFRYGEVRGSDGDDYWLEFIAFSRGDLVRPVGTLAVLGSRTEVRLLVNAAPPYSPLQLKEEFTRALLSSPSELRPSCVVVVYTSIEDEEHWRHVPYTLGWDGSRFLFQESPEHTIFPDETEW